MFARILTWANLCDAWERVAENQGAPGADRVSIRRFGRHWEEHLRRLMDDVKSGRYRPGRLRRIAIPKPTGGQRLITIPTVADRVLQRATLNVLEPAGERLFLGCSHGYRPGRSLHSALAEILRFRNYGLTWVLDADITACFDSLDHNLLRSFLADLSIDAGTLALVDRWLVAGRRFRNPDRGIALGMPISPLLCNLYLHQLDWDLVRGRWAVVRYADDFVICCHSQAHAQHAQEVTAAILARLNLTLHPNKTQIVSFDQGFDYLGIHFEADSYSFVWQEKRFEVRGPTPGWLWGYVPDGYE